MSIRGKTKYRLLILAVAAAVLVMAAAAVYTIRSRQIAAELVRSRDAGLLALDAGDYHSALHQIGRYVQRHPKDADALYAYAQAREHVPLQDGTHLLEATAFYRRVLDIQPDHTDAGHRLINLYVEMGYNPETLSLAERILQRNPADADALQAKAIALARSRKFGEALAAARKHNEVDPLGLEFQFVTLQIMRQAGESNEKLLAYAQALRTAHPDDARLDLVQAYASMMTGDKAGALDWIRKAAAHEMVDPEVIARTVSMLDAAGQFNEALSVMERAVGQSHDPRTTSLLVGRWWQLRRWQRIADYLEGTEATGRSADSRIAGLHATALTELGRHQEAQAILAKLSLRRDDAEAAAWSELIPVVFAAAPDQKQMLTVCSDALSRVPASPYFRFLLGRAYEQVGEAELALDHWRKASELAPGWPAPFLERSRLLLRLGRNSDALAAAQEARRRSPDGPEALLATALAGSKMVNAKSTQQIGGLAAILGDLERIAPRYEPGIPARIQLMARAGQREQAIVAIALALEMEPALGRETLLAIAAASESSGLGQEQACYDRCRKLYGITPDLALAQARSWQGRGQASEGINLFSPAPPQPRTGDALDWKLAEARYRDEIGEASARLLWVRLADGNPGDARVQWGAESARCLSDDREVRDRVLKRLQELIGPQGVAWRIARARWLLGKEPTEKQVVEAAALLSEATRIVPGEPTPHYLLAQCMERLNNPAVAIEQLTIVAEADKQNHDASLRLARLLHRKGEGNRALEYVNRVLRSGDLPVATIRQAAAALVELDDLDRAARLVEALRQADASSRESDLLLARIYWQRKQHDRTEEILSSLLRNPDENVIRFAVDFYLSQGRVADAERALALLDKAGTDPAVAAVIRGDFYSRTAQLDRALEVCTAAAEASPANPVVWRALVLHHLSRNDVDGALAAAERAGQSVPQEQTLAFLRRERDGIRELSGEPMLRPLLIAVFSSADNAAPASEAIGILAQAKKAGETAAQVAARLRPLADRNPKLLPLQLALVRLCRTCGKLEDAVAVANRTVQLFPDLVEPAQAAATSLAAAGRWAEALPAAQRWRSLSAEQAAGADALIASVYLGLAQPEKALQCIQPYMDAAWTSPDARSQWILLWAQAQLRCGRPAQAEQALLPLVRASAQWRRLWMRIAIEPATASSTAEQWLRTVAGCIPGDALEERIGLAQAWQQLAVRTQNRQYQDQARQMATQLATEVQARRDLSGEQVQLVAMLCEAQDDRQTARALYRQALESDPRLGASMNNLASILAEEGADLAQAMALATAAVQGSPNVAAFRDTLGYVSIRQGQFGPAVESLGKAVELQPDNCAYRIRLATALLGSGQDDKARQMLAHVEALRPDSIPLPDRDREQLKMLRSRLAPATAQ